MKKQRFFFKMSYTFPPNSLPSPLYMTCCVSTVSCKVEDVMFIIPHTNITVRFRQIVLVNKKYIFVDRQ